MKKIYLVDWTNNYGLDCVVIIGDLTPEQAKQIAIDKAGAWPGFINVQEIKIGKTSKPTIIYPENKS